MVRRHGINKAAALAALPAFLLAACSSGEEPVASSLATAQFSTAQQNFTIFESQSDQRLFLGAVAADEPRAALAGRDVLEQGGTAADAATAMYFTLAVTLPNAAGVGGGGICLVHDPLERKVESVAFLPRRSAAGGPLAIPGNVRGFALLQARYGRLPWSSLMAPAEVLAAQGHEVSRAFVSEMAPITPAIQSVPALASTYLRPNGQPLREGDLLVQPGLAATLGKVRANGPRGLYSGGEARAIIETAAASGTAISMEEMLGYRPEVADAVTVPFDNNVLALPAANTGAGTFMSALWPHALSSQGPALLDAARSELARLRAEPNLPDVYGSTGFVAATAGGEAVACAVTMNGPFGSGRVVPGSGIVLPRSPETAGFGLAGAFLAPALIVNPNNGSLFFAGSGAGSPRAPAAVLDLAARTTGGGEDLLSAIGNTLSDGQSLVNAIQCPQGAPAENASCTLAKDPHGSGLGAVGAPAVN